MVPKMSTSISTVKKIESKAQLKTNLNIIPGCSTGWAKSVSPEERRRLSVSDQLLPPNTRSLFLIIIARHFSPHMSKLTNSTLIRILPFILLLVVIPLVLLPQSHSTPRVKRLMQPTYIMIPIFALHQTACRKKKDWTWKGRF